MNNANNNDFDKLIRGKMEQFTLPVSEECWDNIAQRLNKKPRRIVYLPWISGAAVAAAVVLIWLIFPFNKKIFYNETTRELSGDEERIAQVVLDGEDVLHHDAQHEKNATQFPAKKSGSNLQRIQPVSELVAHSLEKEANVQDDVALQDAEEELPTPTKQQTLPAVKDPFDLPEYSARQAKKSRKTGIALSVGSGGFLAMNSSLAEINEQGPMRANSAMLAQKAPAELRNSVLQAKDFDHIVQRPPLSFGLSISNELNSRFAVESGVMYTYLSSSFSNKSPRQDALLELHYIGIPLNLQFSLFRSPQKRWHIYLAGGGACEKGVFSHYTQNVYPEDNSIDVETTYINEKIDGLQWSLNGAAGVEYKFKGNYGVFLEPKLIYYLKNNQPMSARTENPLIIGITAGVRFVVSD